LSQMSEVVKSYAIPIEAPRDLIDAYLEVKQKALEMVMAHVSYSSKGKARLRLKAEQRRRIRNRLLEGWPYASHYVDSAINSVIGLVKGWIKLYNRGRAKRKPEITSRTVYIKSTLFKVKGDKLIIRIVARERYLEVDLSKFGYLPRDYDSIGGLLMTDDRLYITFKRSAEPREPNGWSAFDVNEANITEARDGAGVIKYDLRDLYHIHRVYEEKRRRIQALRKTHPRRSKRLMEKYGRRERNRTKDFLHKLTTKIVGELASLNYGIILEDLNGIKERTAKKGRANKKIRRRLSKWNARTFQFMLAYKAAWAGLPVRFVDPAYSSRTCPVCSGHLKAYRGRFMRCEDCGLVIDRDEAAALNLRMRGAPGFPREGRIYGDDAQGRCMSTSDDISRTPLKIFFWKLGNYYVCSNSVKTQPFTIEEVQPNLRYHKWICMVLKRLEKLPWWKFYVGDDSGYYDTMDEQKLRESFEATSKIIWAVSSAIQEAIDKARLPWRGMIGGRYDIKEMRDKLKRYGGQTRVEDHDDRQTRLDDFDGGDPHRLWTHPLTTSSHVATTGLIPS